MRTRLPSIQKAGGAWTRTMILFCLYSLLLESVAEWGLVLYLYQGGTVDAEMTPSVVITLSASFLSVSLVILHSLLAWQYNRTTGFGIQKTLLHPACTYLLRTIVVVWLAASIAGLTVVSKRLVSIPSSSGAGAWEHGLSCKLYRAAVFIAIISFVTACAFCFARQLYDRPYDVSLLGVYKQQRRPRNASIFSDSSWESEGLKNEIIYLCSHPSAFCSERALYWSPTHASTNDLSFRTPAIRCPSTSFSRPLITVNTDPFFVHSEVASRTTISPDSSSPTTSLGEQSLTRPISRTSTVRSNLSMSERRVSIPPVAELPNTPEVPAIPAKYIHRRAKSSVSSFRRFLPKALPVSIPFSSDPQIQAFVDPPVNAYHENFLRRQPTTCVSAPELSSPALETSRLKSATPAEINDRSAMPSPPQSSDSATRTLTMRSANAPEVVPQPEQARVRRSRTSYATAAPRPTNHPHHHHHVLTAPNYSNPIGRSLTRGISQKRPAPYEPDNVQDQSRTIRNSFNPQSTPTRTSDHDHVPHLDRQAHHLPRLSSSHPRHSHSYSHSMHHDPAPGLARMQSRRFYPPQPRNINMPPIPRSDDIEVIFPSTRRKRSSTYGGGSNRSSNLSSIRESVQLPVNDAQGRSSTSSFGALLDQKTYRGANRTSIQQVL